MIKAQSKQKKADMKKGFSIPNECGMTLIAVLWIVTILTILASEFMYSMQLEVRSSRNWNDQVRALYAAKGGFETALSDLRSDETSYDSLDEDWSKGFTGELNNSTFETTITDESARINVNTIDEETLTRVIEYCMMSLPSYKELADAERTANAQTLARAIIENRPYRTTAEMAKVTDMTPELLYGYTGTSEDEETVTNEEGEEEQQIISLVDVTTVYSVDKNVANDGKDRVNITSVDANQIQQNINPQGQEIITQQEAQAIVDYRSQSSEGSGQQGGQPGQPGGAPGGQQGGYKSIADLLNVPAVSQQTYDSIRDRITVSDEESGQQGGQQEGQQRKVNINTASADELRSLSDRIDNGIADSIVRYRQNNQFDNTDEIMQVKAISIEDMKVIVDRVRLTDDATAQGKVNINTVSSELLRILPGLDEEKANAIITRREAGTQQGSNTGAQQSNQQGGPFDNIGQLLDVQGIDENTFRQIVDAVTYRTCAFRIESQGKSSDEKIIQICTAVIDRSENNIQIKYWKQF